MSNLLHCDIGEVVQYLREQNKIFYAIRLSDCLQHSNESLVKLTIENEKLHQRIKELQGLIDSMSDEITMLINQRDDARQLVCQLTSELDALNKIYILPEQVAEEYGWDCYKTEADNNNDHFRTHHR